jgi:hypothetical protein
MLHWLFREIKSTRKIWLVPVPCMEELRNIYKILVGNLEARDHSENPDLDVRIILEWISKL